jgi:hypothetical protein
VYLGLGEDQGVQITADASLFQRRDIQLEPPLVVVGIEKLACWRKEMMAMEEGVQTVLGLGREAHHLGPLGNQGAMIANFQRGNPDGGQEPDGVQVGQGTGRDLVGHHLGASDEGDVGRVDHRDRMDVG